MSISRWIYEPFYSFQIEADRAFEDFFPTCRSQIGSPSGNEIAVRPRLDLHESLETNSVTATFELPGLKKEDVKIDVHNNALTVSGETSSSTQKEESGYVIRERRFGRFSRSVRLPEGIKHEDIKASMDNGVLTVTFPRSAPEAVPKKITIS